MNDKTKRKLVFACQAVLQSVGGTNAEATKVAHDKALKELHAALGDFIKADRRRN